MMVFKRTKLGKFTLKRGMCTLMKVRNSKDNNYDVIDIGMCVDFLSRHQNNVSNDVFKSFFEYICKIKENRENRLTKFLNFHGDIHAHHRVFKYSHVQWGIHVATTRKTGANVYNRQGVIFIP